MSQEHFSTKTQTFLQICVFGQHLPLKLSKFPNEHCINEFVPLPRDFFGRQGMTTKRSGATLRRNDEVCRKKTRQGCGRIMQCFLNFFVPPQRRSLPWPLPAPTPSAQVGDRASRQGLCRRLRRFFSSAPCPAYP